MAFSFPAFKRDDDDSLFLPYSDYELLEGELVFRLTRLRGAAGPRIRVAAFKQVYEAQLSRLGHSVAAGFEFIAEMPRGNIIAETLGELVGVIEQHCCRSGHFCDYDTFRRFLEREIMPSFEGIIGQLELTRCRALLQLPFGQGLGQRIFAPAEVDDFAAVGKVIDWFGTNPSGLVCDTLILGASSRGGAGKALRRVSSIVELEPEFASALYRSLVSVSGSFEEISTKATEELRSQQDRNAQLESKLMVLQESKAQELQPSAPVQRYEDAPFLSGGPIQIPMADGVNRHQSQGMHHAQLPPSPMPPLAGYPSARTRHSVPRLKRLYADEDFEAAHKKPAWSTKRIIVAALGLTAAIALIFLAYHVVSGLGRLNAPSGFI
jgi:hypothetical protein